MLSSTIGNEIPPREPPDVRALRFVLKRWPFYRGKGALIRLFAPVLNRREFFVEVEPGISIPADLDDYMVYWVFAHGYESDAAVRLSRKLLRPGDQVVDAGANIGLWAMGAARIVGDAGAVHAFEPVFSNYQRLQANLTLNRLGSVHCSMVALSDRTGSAVIYEPTYNNSGHPSLGKREGLEKGSEIEAITLDSYTERVGLGTIDFMKIDVEGAELLVLRGATRVLSGESPPIILFEVNEDTASRLGYDTTMVKTFLFERGYHLFRFDGRRLHPVPVDRREEPGDLFAFQPAHFQCRPSLEQLKVERR